MHLHCDVCGSNGSVSFDKIESTSTLMARCRTCRAAGAEPWGSMVKRMARESESSPAWDAKIAATCRRLHRDPKKFYQEVDIMRRNREEGAERHPVMVD